MNEKTESDVLVAEPRLWARVKRGPDCWDWQGALNTWGYGVIRVGRGRMLTHRLSLMLAKGPPPMGKPLALHGCDRPCCVNPAHLRWGDHQDNRDDRSYRVRPPFPKNILTQTIAQSGVQL